MKLIDEPYDVENPEASLSKNFIFEQSQSEILPEKTIPGTLRTAMKQSLIAK